MCRNSSKPPCATDALQREAGTNCFCIVLPLFKSASSSTISTSVLDMYFNIVLPSLSVPHVCESFGMNVLMR